MDVSHNIAWKVWPAALTHVVIHREVVMLRFIGLVLMSVVCQSALACGGTSDHYRPLDAIAASTSALLQKREFKVLNKLADEYRTQNTLASDGQPKLMGFYGGIAKSAAGCSDRKESAEAWNNERRLLSDWGKASPRSVTPKLALAILEANYAWDARGGGYASTVTDEGWQLFKQRNAKARAMLEKLRVEAANDPQWYEEMLRMGLAQGWGREQFDEMYEKAVKKFPFYYAYYFTKGEFYSAKWHGSQRDFKAFVDESVKATESQVGQSMYARLNWSAWQGKMFFDGQTDWGRMKDGFEKLVSDFPDPWNRNNYAKFACMANDANALRQQLDLIGEKIIIGAWGDMSFLQYCQKFLVRSAEDDANKRKRAALSAGAGK
jgi:hypothetical protein